MRTAVCTGRLTCFSGGVFGTSAALCVAGLAWLVVEILAAGGSVGAQIRVFAGALVVFAPTVLSVVLAGGMYITRSQPGPIATILTICGAAWTVLALNMWVSL